MPTDRSAAITGCQTPNFIDLRTTSTNRPLRDHSQLMNLQPSSPSRPLATHLSIKHAPKCPAQDISSLHRLVECGGEPPSIPDAPTDTSHQPPQLVDDSDISEPI